LYLSMIRRIDFSKHNSHFTTIYNILEQVFNVIIEIINISKDHLFLTH
jgi:hypothetical protein